MSYVLYNQYLYWAIRNAHRLQGNDLVLYEYLGGCALLLPGYLQCRKKDPFKQGDILIISDQTAKPAVTRRQMPKTRLGG